MTGSWLRLLLPLLCGGCAFFGIDPEDSNHIDESQLIIRAGDNQAGRPGVYLPVPVMVRINGANSNSPIGNQVIQWTVVSGGGSISASTSLTDSYGESAIQWAPGTGAVQQLRASVDIPGPDTTVVFTAMVLRLEILSGDRQAVGRSGSAEPLRVRLLDGDGIPLTGAVVHWAIGGGFLVDTTSTIGIDGIAAMPVRAPATGELRPTEAVARLEQNPLDAVTFKVLTPYRLRALSGDHQTGAPGTRLALPVTVTFDDTATGEPGQAGNLRWEVVDGGGVVEDPVSLYNGGGARDNRWVLGPAPGPQHLRVFVDYGDQDVTPIDTLILTATGVLGAAGCGGIGTLHAGDGSYIATSETWTAAASPHIVRSIVRYDVNATLTIEAGATVCLENTAGIYLTRDLQAVGTASAPIRFLAADSSSPWGSITLGGGAGVPLSRISNARIEHSFTAINAATPVRIDSSIIRQSRNMAIVIQNSATTNQIIHTTIDTTRGNNPAVLLNAPGVRFAGTIRGANSTGLMVNADNVRLEACEISGGKGFGVLTGGYNGTVVTGCNLTTNANYAVAAGGGVSVDARFNWWGNPAGPSGVANGISAGVDASAYLAVPAVMGYRPSW